MCAHPSNPTSNLAPAPRLPRRSALPNPCMLTARESHVLLLLACAGMAFNTHGVHLEQAELLLGATAAPAVRFRSAGAGPLQAAGWCSRAVGSGVTISSPLTMIKGSSSISVWWTFSSFAHRRDFWSIACAAPFVVCVCASCERGRDGGCWSCLGSVRVSLCLCSFWVIFL